MGCRCTERKISIARANTAVANGQFRVARRELKTAVSTFAQDVRSREARREMLMRLARVKAR